MKPTQYTIVILFTILCNVLSATVYAANDNNGQTRAHVLDVVTQNRVVQEIIKQYLNTYDRAHQRGSVESQGAQLIAAAPHGRSFIFAKSQRRDGIANFMHRNGKKYETTLYNVSAVTWVADVFPGIWAAHSITAICYTPDGRYVAVAHGNDDIQVLRVTKKALYPAYNLKKQALEGASVTSLAYAPHAQDMAVGLLQKNGSCVRIYDTNTDQCKKEGSGTGKVGCSVAFSPNGLYIAQSRRVNNMSSIVLHDATSVQFLGELSDKRPAIIGKIAFTPDSKYIAGAMHYLPTLDQAKARHAIVFWDLSTGLKSHEISRLKNINSFDFLFGGALITIAASQQPLVTLANRAYELDLI